MSKTVDELRAQSERIANATQAGENTASRVGGTITDIVDHIASLEDGNGAVANIAQGAVGRDNIDNGAVDEYAIADGAVKTSKIADAAVVASKLAQGAITTEKIAQGAVTADALADAVKSLQWSEVQFTDIDALSGVSSLNTLTAYKVKSGKKTCGYMFMTIDFGTNQIAQYMITSLILPSDSYSYDYNQQSLYVRTFALKGSYESAQGTWSTWRKMISTFNEKLSFSSDGRSETYGAEIGKTIDLTATDVYKLKEVLNNFESGIIYDVSAHNSGAVFKSLQNLLSSSNLSTLIPTSVRYGGMTIKFIQGSEQSSDNNYVQYRLMSTSFSTDEADWQGVDDKPIVGSNNLVKSGGVANAINKFPPMGSTAIIKDNDTNLLLNTTFTDGKYLYIDGQEKSLSIFSYTDYIDITGISHIKIHNLPENGGCFYDKEKNYISGFGIGYGFKGNNNNLVIEVPENAVYVRVNVDISYRKNGTAYVMDNNKYPALVDYPWIAERQVGVRLYAVGTTSGYMADNGEINTSIASGGIITKYDVNGVKSVNISMSEDLSLGVTPRWCTIWVVDESDNPILMLPVDVTGNILEKYPLTIPENGVQLWLQGKSAKAYRTTEFTTAIEDIQNTIDELQREISSPVNQWTGKKIVWLGTSIPYGQGTDGVASALTTYPMQVGSKLGATVVNVARPGMAIETTEDFKRKTYGSLSLTIAELQSEGASTTPYQSYENTMLGQDADLYIFDCEPNNSNWDLTDLENFSVANWAYNDSSTFESHRNSYVGALLFLLDKLWTEKPSAKVVFVSEFISGANLDDKYEGLTASKAVAEKLRIPLINVASKLYYTPLNKSLYLNSDNVHPKQATHDRIANILAQELLTVS